jgi:hypothetical protein
VSWETSDGAAFGITPERALATILGGEPSPPQSEWLSMPQLRAWIEAVPAGPARSYDDAARIVAGAMFALLEQHPEVAPLSADALGPRWRALDPAGWKALDARAVGPTAFQFGWAWNAVRAIRGLPTGKNPALLEVG